MPPAPGPESSGLDAPDLVGGCPIAELGGLKPKADLKGGRVGPIRAVDHIAADVHGQVTADRAGLGLQGLGGPNQLAGTGNHAIAFPNHRHHGAAGNEVHQASKKGALPVDAVVAFSQGPAGGQLFQTDQLETLALKTAEDLTHQTPLDPIRLDGNKAAFDGHGVGMKVGPSSVAALPLGKQAEPDQQLGGWLRRLGTGTQGRDALLAP